MKLRWRTLLKRNSRILSKRRLKKCFPNFPVSKNSLHVQKLQNMTNRAHWPDYHHSFLFPRNHFHSKWYESKKKTPRKSCLDCWFFCILKPSTEFCCFEEIARLKMHPVGKNNFNAPSKSSTTPYDRWVQAILQPSNVVRRCTWLREWSSGWSWRRTILADLKARSTNISIILHL